jgi:hypothetical protein
MKLQLEWARAMPLRDAGRFENLLYTLDYSELPETSGVYVLGRRYGRKFEALYVGKAGSIRWRVRGQLKNLPLMLHLKKAKSGKRIILAGRFVPRPGQQEAKCLTLLERALIRYFLSEGHDLVNKLASACPREAAMLPATNARYTSSSGGGLFRPLSLTSLRIRRAS